MPVKLARVIAIQWVLLMSGAPLAIASGEGEPVELPLVRGSAVVGRSITMARRPNRSARRVRSLRHTSRSESSAGA